MSSNPQWGIQPPFAPMDNSILDYKTLATMGDDHPYSNHPLNNIFQSGMGSKEQSIFGKSSSNSSSSSYNLNNANFSIGTFSAMSERPPPPQQQQQQQQPNNTFGDVFSSSSIPIPGVAGITGSYASGGGSNQQHDNQANQGIRETGIIEKLLHSYGFIQCCERQARLFFHFSQFNGNIEHLKIGDPVEFEMTYDRRTGKPIASAVSKIAPEVVGVVLSEERVTGTVTTELRTEGNTDTLGRISYENRGECFFLPYNKDDVEGNVILSAGDKVSFQIAAKNKGNLGACHIRLENPAHPVKYQGVVCSMKESFGFIERADVVKEIFFHFSEAKLPTGEEFRLGDDVEFIILTRNGKEVACNIIRLDPGSVVFEDVCTEVVKGQVLKPLERGPHARAQEDPLPGRIRYRAADHSEVEIPFGEKDQRGDFTLRHGDWVQFRVATDRRDQLRRATNISLLEESFIVSGERREQGMISSTKEGFGFIKCADRDLRVFFHFNEVLDVERGVRVNDEVEFTVIQDSQSTYSNTRQSAIRIKVVPPGTVQFETLIHTNLKGVVAKEAQHWGSRSPSKHNPQSPTNGEKNPDPGLINYQQGDVKSTIAFYHKDNEGRKCHVGDEVEFDVVQVKRNKEYLAIKVQVINNGKQAATNGATSGEVQQGFIAALKEAFGFIETLNHDREIFFHFSNFDGDVEKLALGSEVEYHLVVRDSGGSCMGAENVRLLPKGSLEVPQGQGPMLEGAVLRPLRCVNPEQAEYAGLIQAGEGDTEYEFGITGLVNKRDRLQSGDMVSFQVDTEGRATNIARKKRKAVIVALKGQSKWVAYDVEEGNKLIFRATEDQDGLSLQPGDTVEFNPRSGRSPACIVTKCSESGPRPERLINRLRTMSVEESSQRVTVLRQPRGPGGDGFSADARTPRSPGVPCPDP